jgi:hypothetical protein
LSKTNERGDLVEFLSGLKDFEFVSAIEKLADEAAREVTEGSSTAMNAYLRAQLFSNSTKDEIASDVNSVLNALETEVEVVQKSFASTDSITVHSGGASGADSLFAQIADELGIPTKAYSYKGHTIDEGAPEYLAGFRGIRPALEERIVLSDAELLANRDSLVSAGNNIKYFTDKKTGRVVTEPNGKNLGKTLTLSNRLIYRNAYQVNNADAVIAVGKFVQGPDAQFRANVDGGTGWAVELGILQNKPVYVYSIGNKKWVKFNYETNNWESIEGMPPKFTNFAGIGSREVTGGEQAVKDYLEQYKGGIAATTPTSTTTEVVTRASNKNAVKEIVDAGGVYIGRKSATYNYPGFYGNPYVVQGGKVKEAVDAYKEDLVSVLQGNPNPNSKIVKYYKDNFNVDVSTEDGRSRLLERIKQLEGKKIVCAGTEPADQCHGNILVEVLEMIKNGEI